MFFEAWWAVPYQDIFEVRSPGRGRGGFVEAPQYSCIRPTTRVKNFKENFLKKLLKKRYNCNYMM